LEGFVGQSLENESLGLRVVRTDGKKLSYEHAAVRISAKLPVTPSTFYSALRIKDDRF